MCSSPINIPGSFARPLFWHMEGRRRKKPLLALLARQGFPNFQEQGVARITLFFFPLVYKHYFHLWFLIALAAALKLSVLVEHVSCVEALGGEFSDKPRAEKSVLHVEAVCQKGFHSSGCGCSAACARSQEVLGTLAARKQAPGTIRPGSGSSE